MYKSILTILILLYCGSAQAETLTASWYSRESLITEGTWKNGERRMANGERFNDLCDTVATRLFPLNSRVRVTSIETGKSVIVKVTDRIGKRFANTRVDLSIGAFKKLANPKVGLIKVEVNPI